MSLKEKLDQDFKKALKGKDTVRVSVIRLLKTAIKNREVEKRDELSEEEILQAVNSQAKTRKESIGEFQKAGRDDLVKKEEQELSILTEYLPEQLTPKELEKIVDNAIGEAGAEGPKDMGNVMKALMPKVTGRADGKIVSQMVKDKLSSL
jgi:uncharacterized protein YqeY